MNGFSSECRGVFITLREKITLRETQNTSSELTCVWVLCECLTCINLWSGLSARWGGGRGPGSGPGSKRTQMSVSEPIRLPGVATTNSISATAPAAPAPYHHTCRHDSPPFHLITQHTIATSHTHHTPHTPLADALEVLLATQVCRGYMYVGALPPL